MKIPPRPEYEDMVAIFEWSNINEYRWPCLEVLFGSIMGVKLHPGQLNKYKKAGMKKGKPDINLPVPRGGFCGLWIELKAMSDTKGASPDQMRILRLLAREGNACYVRWGSEDAIRTIEAYVKGEIKKDEAKKNREKTRAEPKKTVKGEALSRD